MCPDGGEPGERDGDPVEDAVPEAIADKPAELTGEIAALPPEEASKVAAEIRAVAEQRSEDSDAVELIDLQKSGPLPLLTRPEDDDTLTADELRDLVTYLVSLKGERP